MIDLKSIYDDVLLCEGFSTPKYLFDDGELTFADIRDILTKMFSGGLTIQELNDGIDVLVTFKDGKACIAHAAKELKDPIDISCASDKLCDESPEIKACFTSSLNDLTKALKCLDQVQLNKFFANGKNFMSCKLIYPPCQNAADYGKCFIVLNGLKCYNDKFKEVGEDKQSADELFGKLKSCDALQQQTFEITQPAVLKLKNLPKSKKILDKILQQLSKFISGLGWKCSLNEYIQDRYSRQIVNKALEHGLDVSRGSDFVSELASRLSNVSGRKPTKSDLLTFAKREGINCKCDEYKRFIDDLEQHAEQTNTDIVRPIENLIAYAALMLMKDVEGYMAADPSPKAKKALQQLNQDITQIEESDIELTPEKIAAFKKNLAKIEKYHESMPTSGVAITYKGKAYKLCPCFGDAHAILNIIKYK